MLNRSDQNRRGGLRRLDDILETLEQLNLHDKTELPEGDAAALSHHDRRRAPPPEKAKSVARLRPGLKPAHWIELFRRIGAGVRGAVLPIAGTDAGRVRFEVGAGGDTTMEVDRAAETVVFAELEALARGRGETFSVLSEESGLRAYGAPYPLVLVDPVDGSLNAKQGVPVFGLMLAVLDGPAIDDTFAGYVINLNTGEEWTAIRKQGARRAGVHLEVIPRQEPKRIQILGLESSPRAIAAARPLVVGPLPANLERRTTLLCAPTKAMHEEALKILGAQP